MKKLIVFSLVVFFAMVSFNSCKKYEDGPRLSLRSKTNRLVGEWKLSKATDKNGIDVTSLFKNFLITFTETDYESSQNGVKGSGTWTFDDKKVNVLIKPSGTGDEEKLFIIRLTNDEFTFEHTIGVITTRYYYITN
jgi:hypothetical protein